MLQLPSFTGNYKFKFLSGINALLGEVSPTPTLTVYGAPIPIAETKVNDANGLAVRLG